MHAWNCVAHQSKRPHNIFQPPLHRYVAHIEELVCIRIRVEQFADGSGILHEHVKVDTVRDDRNTTWVDSVGNQAIASLFHHCEYMIESLCYPLLNFTS